jgi:hypothetical protein
MAKKDQGLNSKNVDFTAPGMGLALGGVTDRNLYAKYDKLRGAKDEKAGGSKQLWTNLSRWTSTPQGKNLDPTQAKLFNQYIATGKKPAGLSDKTTMAAMDWGLREAGRFQQHKPISLLEKVLGPVLTIAASSIPVIGPYAGAAMGAYVGQRNGGGALGGLLGAVGGYTGGTSIANAGGLSGIYNSARNGLGNLLGSGGGFSNPSALGLSGSNLGLNFASAPGGFASTAIPGYGASGLGLSGANLGAGLVNSLGGTSIPGYGNSAIGGTLDTPGLVNAPSAGSTSIAGPPRSMLDKGIRAARTGLRMADALSPPEQAGGGLMSAGPVGQAKPMIQSGVAMRPFTPYQYFRPNTNPFMARIV